MNALLPSAVIMPYRRSPLSPERGFPFRPIGNSNNLRENSEIYSKIQLQDNAVCDTMIMSGVIPLFIKNHDGE